MTMLAAWSCSPRPTRAGRRGKAPTIKIKVRSLAWAVGREIINTLSRMPHAEIPIDAEIAAICDTYPASLKRAAASCPARRRPADYKIILDNKDIQAVVIAHRHRPQRVALAALKAGKHVYCEARWPATSKTRERSPGGQSGEAAGFQVGLQIAVGQAAPLSCCRSFVRGRWAPRPGPAQWHKKTSWRSTSPIPRGEGPQLAPEKATSLGSSARSAAPG